MNISDNCKGYVAIIDFGSQYTQLITRRIRELSVYSEIFLPSVDIEKIKNPACRCVILSGGPESVFDEKSIKSQFNWLDLKVPVLGICYGMQLLTHELGGKVEPSIHREYGHTDITIDNQSPLFSRCNSASKDIGVWMSHGDRVEKLPHGFKAIASSSSSPIAAMANEELKCYGLQFHPEVSHTVCGQEILEAFVFDIAKCKRNWKVTNLIQDIVEDIRQQVNDDEVILGLSGGVDSSVAALLIHKAIGKKLHCVFIDNGLLRLNERQQVINTFAENFDIDLHTVRAEKDFLKALEGVTDPEQKRRIIGKIFVEVFEREAQRFEGIKWLAQGTIYPDIVESAKQKGAHLIKSHHNVGGLPSDMNLKVLEPLSSLFKDEVRKVGKELGLNDDLVFKHPFPGPGLAIRVIGALTKEVLDLARQVDAIFIEELKTKGFYYKVAQAFGVVLPVRSVGVMGDQRQYGYVVVLRAVETDDFMTAHCAELPYDFITHVARRIVNEVTDISRVCYDISGKPPATIEWE